MSTLEKVDLFNKSWRYRGEGNANIVIALEEELRVIRLAKSPKQGQKKDGSNHADEVIRGHNHYQKLHREVTCTNHIVRPLVGTGVVSPATIVEISVDQIEFLNRELQHHRPQSRLHKELRYPYATTHTDLARLHSSVSGRVDYCVEIKPKQGWVESSPIFEASGLCNFCLHQFWKLKHQKITNRSKYCPLNLFSGSPEKMINALLALLENPQNNLRIFKNGHLLYDEMKLTRLETTLTEGFKDEKPEGFPNDEPEKMTTLKRFLYIICLALMRPLNEASSDKFFTFEEKLRTLLLDLDIEERNPQVNCGGKQYCPDITENILHTVLKLQLASTEQPSSILEIYKRICSVHSNNAPSVVSDVTCPDNICFENEVWIDEIREKGILNTEELTRLEKFLVSASARDCSIMVTFSSVGILNESDISKLQKQSSASLPDNNCDNSSAIFYLHDYYNSSQMFKVKVGLADLDLKPVTCIPKQCLRDCDMLETYKELSSKPLSSPIGQA